MVANVLQLMYHWTGCKHLALFGALEVAITERSLRMPGGLPKPLPPQRDKEPTRIELPLRCQVGTYIHNDFKDLFDWKLVHEICRAQPSQSPRSNLHKLKMGMSTNGVLPRAGGQLIIWGGMWVSHFW